MNSGVVKEGSVGLSPLLKFVRDFGGLRPLLRASFRLHKFITTHLSMGKKGKVRFYHKKKNARTLYLLSSYFNTFNTLV